MSKSRVAAVVLALGFVFLAACGGGGNSGSFNPPPGQGGSAAVSVSLTDTPPPGVSVLSFEVRITGATLQPGNVQLVTSPVEVEVKKLEVEAAFLNTVNVPAGTYNSITVNFANPELTILNSTGAAISFAGVNCASGQVCEFEPTVSGSATFNFASPLTITANTPAGLLVDVNLNNIIQSPLGLSFTGASAITVTQLSAQQGTGQFEEIEDLNGVVAGKDTANNQFTLQTAAGSFTVRVDASTLFDDFNDDGGCAANNFTCVQNGQAVEVDLKLMPGGIFLARKIEFEDGAADDELEGVITSVDSATQFKMVVVEELRDIAGIDVGNAATITLTGGATFRVDEDGLTVPATPRSLFEGATDTSQLLPGQVVQVRRLASSSGTNISTDRVRLRMSRFTATIASLAAPNFVVNNLPSLFGSGAQIQVQTSAQTDFDNAPSGLGSLAVGNTVSLRGLLFKATPDSLLIAKKVRKR